MSKKQQGERNERSEKQLNAQGDGNSEPLTETTDAEQMANEGGLEETIDEAEVAAKSDKDENDEPSE